MPCATCFYVHQGYRVLTYSQMVEVPLFWESPKACHGHGWYQKGPWRIAIWDLGFGSEREKKGKSLPFLPFA